MVLLLGLPHAALALVCHVGFGEVTRARRTRPVLVTATVAALACSTAMGVMAQDDRSADPIDLVVIGDSIPYGGSRASFFRLWAGQLEHAMDRPVEIHDRSRNDGAGLGEIRSQVADDDALRAEIAEAEVIVVSVGYNNVLPDPTLGVGCPGDLDGSLTGYITWALATPSDCYAAFFEEHAATYDEIFATITDLREGAPTVYTALNVHDGNLEWVRSSVAELPGDAMADFERWLIGVYDDWNAMLCDRASRAGFTCVDVYHAFNGADGRQTSEPWTLDGAHPNYEGHALIASLFVDVDISAIEHAAP